MNVKSVPIPTADEYLFNINAVIKKMLLKLYLTYNCIHKYI